VALPFRIPPHPLSLCGCRELMWTTSDDGSRERNVIDRARRLGTKRSVDIRVMPLEQSPPAGAESKIIHVIRCAAAARGRAMPAPHTMASP
jgi:hypothetical protein